VRLIDRRSARAGEDNSELLERPATEHLVSLRPDQLPSTRHVAMLGERRPHRETQHVLPAQHRVRHVRPPAAVDQRQQPPVVRLRRSLLSAPSPDAEAHQREPPRSHHLEPAVRPHHPLERPRHLHVAPDVRLQPRDAVRPQHHPELESSEPATHPHLQVLAVYHQAGLAGPVLEVLRVSPQRLGQPRPVPEPQAGAVEAGEQPLVGADAEGVRSLHPVEEAPELGADARAARVRRVHVHPRAELGGHIGDEAQGIHCSGGGGPHGGADVGGHKTRRRVGSHRVAESGRHKRVPRTGSSRDQPDVGLVEPGDSACLGERGMGLVGAVGHEAADRHASGPAHRAVAGGHESAKDGLAGGGVYDAAASTAAVRGGSKSRRQSKQLRQPVKYELLELRGSRTGQPGEGDGVERGGDEVPDEGRGAECGREVSKEVGAGPVGHAGKHRTADVAEGVLEGGAAGGWGGRHEVAEVAGLHLRQHGLRVHVLIIVYDEVDGEQQLLSKIIEVQGLEAINGNHGEVGIKASHGTRRRR
ncbi:unnamed protein product, partial [Musa acuminata subsp. malaccensis]